MQLRRAPPGGGGGGGPVFSFLFFILSCLLMLFWKAFSTNVCVYIHILYVMSVCVLQGRLALDGGRLTLSGIGLSDSGMYQCVARNELGAVHASAELKVAGEQRLYLLLCF